MHITATNRTYSITATPGVTRVVRTPQIVRMAVPASSPATRVTRIPQLQRVTVQGGRGVKGDPGDATALSRVLRTLTAAAAISALRVVRTNALGQAQYVDAATLADAGAAIGISTTAASAAGDTVQVITQGLITDAAWHWIPGMAVYCSLNGQLTQTPPEYPAATWLQVLAVADTPTSLNVNPQDPLILA